MTKDELWQMVLGELEVSVSRASFNTWFKQTFIVAEENNQVIIGVPNMFTQAWFQKKYHDQIVRILRKITDNQIKDIVYKIEFNKNKKELILAEKTLSQIPVIASATDEESIEPTIKPRELSQKNCGLNPKYTFDKFVVGKSNELAHAAARAVAEKPGIVYNPLFLYGGVGLGKTHLLQAVGHLMLQNNFNVKVLYTTCEKFTNDFVNSIRTGKTKEFQEKHREVDLLIIDDIQFIEGKEQTQEQFFHTFNDLFQKNKQLVITSDRPPKAIPTLEERLRSRFECGMIADIGQPDIETRIAIIKAKLEEKEYALKEDIINYIAAGIQSNIRELEGALNRIIAHHNLQKGKESSY